MKIGRAVRLPFALLAIATVLLLAIGCGGVDQVGAGGALGTDAASAGSGGAAGTTSAAGGAAAGGQGGGGPLDGGGHGGAAGAELDGGASWPTCPKVGALAIGFSGHCWSCEGVTDAGFVSGTVAGPCQIASGDAKGLGLGSGPDYCAPRASACP